MSLECHVELLLFAKEIIFRLLSVLIFDYYKYEIPETFERGNSDIDFRMHFFTKGVASFWIGNGNKILQQMANILWTKLTIVLTVVTRFQVTVPGMRINRFTIT